MQKGSQQFHELIDLLHSYYGHNKFDDLLDEIAKLHDKKQADYGTDEDPFANVRASEEFGVPAWVGALIRLNDKTVRLKSLIKNGKLENESAQDSMVDIAVYALIAHILYEATISVLPDGTHGEVCPAPEGLRTDTVESWTPFGGHPPADPGGKNG